MSKFSTKIIMLVLLSCFCIFFGVDLATRGMGRIQGPVLPEGKTSSNPVSMLQQSAQGRAVSTASEVKQTAAGVRGDASKAKTSSVDMTLATHDQELNYIGNKLGDLLQIAAHHSMRFLVSLLNSLVG